MLLKVVPCWRHRITYLVINETSDHVYQRFAKLQHGDEMITLFDVTTPALSYSFFIVVSVLFVRNRLVYSLHSVYIMIFISLLARIVHV